MPRAKVCRVCLASDVSMHRIANTQVQEIFEKLTSKKLTDNGRPETICYLCYTHLQKCCKILDSFKKTENVFEQLLSSGIEITQDAISFIKKSNMLNLMMTPIWHIDVLPVDGFSVTADEKYQNISIKEEPIEVEVECFGMGKEYDVIEGALKDLIYSGSDDSSKDSTWHIENYQMQRSKSTRKKEKKIQNIGKRKQNKTDFISDNSLQTDFISDNYLQSSVVKTDSDQQYTCSDCNKAFTIISNLHRHYENVHKRKYYKCNECNKSYSRSDHLKNHQRSHMGEKRYPCNICKTTFSAKHNVQQHIRSIHSKVKPFFCDKCNKSFSRKGNLQEHYRVHTGEKPYNCDKCNYKSSLLNALKSHISKMHSD